jgi:hypothetical protein
VAPSAEHIAPRSTTRAALRLVIGKECRTPGEHFVDAVRAIFASAGWLDDRGASSVPIPSGLLTNVQSACPVPEVGKGGRGAATRLRMGMGTGGRSWWYEPSGARCLSASVAVTPRPEA